MFFSTSPSEPSPLNRFRGLRCQLASVAVHPQRIALGGRLLDPAGLDKATGIISNARSKSWLDPQGRSDPAVRDFLDWMSKYNPQASLRDQNNVAGYERAQALVEVLKKCGDDLTRANVMKQASNLDLELGMLRPGIKIATTPTTTSPSSSYFSSGLTASTGCRLLGSEDDFGSLLAKAKARTLFQYFQLFTSLPAGAVSSMCFTISPMRICNCSSARWPARRVRLLGSSAAEAGRT